MREKERQKERERERERDMDQVLDYLMDMNIYTRNLPICNSRQCIYIMGL